MKKTYLLPKLWVIIILFLISQVMVAQRHPFQNGLNMIVENNVEIRENKLYLNVLFFNNTEDTILLPIKDYAVCKAYFSLEFMGLSSREAPSCGLVTKRVEGASANRIYNCADFSWIAILPFQFRVYRYNLEHCDPFTMGIRYEYQIRLNLTLDGTIRCPNLWQGLLYSNLGSFTMVK
jgi:hypothetical protein